MWIVAITCILLLTHPIVDAKRGGGGGFSGGRGSSGARSGGGGHYGGSPAGGAPAGGYRPANQGGGMNQGGYRPQPNYGGQPGYHGGSYGGRPGFAAFFSDCFAIENYFQLHRRQRTGFDVARQHFQNGTRRSSR